MPQVKEVTKIKNLKGVRVLLRAPLNVPISKGKVENDFRLKKAIQTLKWLRKSGARIIVVGHLGDDGEKSLRPVSDYINKVVPVKFLEQTKIDAENKVLREMKDRGIIILENLRKHDGEMKNSQAFAKELASLADIYVNDDFTVSHRKHASVVAVTKFLPSFIGPVFSEEVSELSKVFKPKKPFVVLLGGAKFETKLPLVKKFLPVASSIFILGALANSFFKEMGFETGLSLIDKKKLGLATLAKNKKIHLPKDVIVRGKGGVMTKKYEQVTKNEIILDNGPETVKEISLAVKSAKQVLWNGPLGKFEEGFLEGTLGVARAVALSKAHSVIGGGDSVYAITKLGLEKKFNFVSTGGGAMLEFLAKGTTVGYEALKRRS